VGIRGILEKAVDLFPEVERHLHISEKSVVARDWKSL
jgi:hypothetical protein